MRQFVPGSIGAVARQSSECSSFTAPPKLKVIIIKVHVLRLLMNKLRNYLLTSIPQNKRDTKIVNCELFSDTFCSLIFSLKKCK